MSEGGQLGLMIGGACAWGTWYLVRIFQMLRKPRNDFKWTLLR